MSAIPRAVREQIEALRGDAVYFTGEGVLRRVLAILDAADREHEDARTGSTVAEGAPAHGLSAAFCVRCGGWCAGH